MSYFRRYRASEQDAEVFRAQKQLELRQLGGTESDTRAFDAACATQRFAVADRVSAKAPKVPTHLVSNYEAVEVFSLREGRGR